MSALLPPVRCVFLFAALCMVARAGQIDLEGPPGSERFGTSVAVLPNGNMVVTDPLFDLPGPVKDAGAVYLYKHDGTLVSRMTGSSQDDRVGNGGVTVLPGGNYVVISYLWDSQSAEDAGAVTWCSGAAGLEGTVSAGNSLIGAQTGDQAGHAPFEGFGGVTVLKNGNYTVSSPNALGGAGAVTWGGGAAGARGVISRENSLAGTARLDLAGTVAALENGDYAVVCPRWNNGAIEDAGAVILCDGAAGRSGTVSAAIALTGSSTGDHVGGGGLFPLLGGGGVICSPLWSGGGVIQAGAATWFPAGKVFSEPVSATNSLIGVSVADRIGSGGVTVLADGHFVVNSPDWSGGLNAFDAGAVTWGNGLTGSTGPVTAGNSLTGTGVEDQAGSGGSFALPGGDYLVCSPGWHNDSLDDTGAVTRIKGGSPFSGVISPGNSLTGTRAYDSIGSGGITVLNSGHFVISSPEWDNGETPDAGAVTWFERDSIPSGRVSEENSLIGTHPNDRVSGGAPRSGVTALTNGNYVVASPRWNGVGAVTWCPGATGRVGLVGIENSLTGSTRDDAVGGGDYTHYSSDLHGGVTALSDGNYVVASPGWDFREWKDAGAVTWCRGTEKTLGAVSDFNSLIGGLSGDFVGGGGVTALSGGKYAVFSPVWNLPGEGGARASGAVTLSLSGPSAVRGLIKLSHSVMETVNDGGSHLSRAFSADGTLLVVGRPLSNLVNLFSYGISSRPEITVEQPRGTLLSPGGTVDFGEVSIGSGKALQFILRNTGYEGLTAKAVIAGERPTFFTVSTPPATGVTIGGDTVILVTFSPAAPGPQRAALRVISLGADRSPFEITLTGTGVPDGHALSRDISAPQGSGRFGHSVTVLPNGNLVVTDPFFDLPGPVRDAGAVHLHSPDGALVSTLTGSSANDRAGSGGVTVLKNGSFVVSSPHWRNGAFAEAGAVTWVDGATGMSGAISTANSLTGSSAGDAVGAVEARYGGTGGVTPLTGGNYVVCSPRWDNGAVADAGAVTWCGGAGGRAGPVSAENSLTGSAAGDLAGAAGAVALHNGHWVVGSPAWSGRRGAVTWGGGQTGVTGVISAENSLTGASEDDLVGIREGAGLSYQNGIHALRNGHYVVCSPRRDSGAVADAGAVTWCDGFSGRRGGVSPENSLIGTGREDLAGRFGVTELTNANYVIRGYGRTGAGNDYEGMVTWCDGTAGVAGPFTAENSLTGPDVGSGGVTPLANGNYVVNSPGWRGNGEVNAGAVTWCGGLTGLTGKVTEENSLTGSEFFIGLGSGGVTALANGNFVIHSKPGFVTWMPGDGSATGKASAENTFSCGPFPPDSPAVTALANGNYVVGNSRWNSINPGGAVTWCDGVTGRAGEMTAGNSLTGSGSGAGDSIGGGGPELSPGGVTALSNGSFIIASPLWSGNGVTPRAGAVTWVDGAAGLPGAVVSAQNSLTGAAAFDFTGGRVTAFEDGHYAVFSPLKKNRSALNAGAVTLGDGSGPLTGTVSVLNSVLGAEPERGFDMSAAFRASDRTFFVARPSENIVSIFRYNIGGPVPAVAVTQSGGGELANGGILNFGEVESGESSSRSFTVRNTGGGPFDLAAVALDDPQFAVTPAGPAGTLNPLQIVEFTVTFTPDSEGVKYAALTLSGGEPQAELFTLTVTGTGKAPEGTGAPFGEGGGSPRAERLADGRVGLSFKALPGAGYLLQRSTDLRTWTEGAPVTADAEGNILWTDEAPPEVKAFYRLKVP